MPTVPRPIRVRLSVRVRWAGADVTSPRLSGQRVRRGESFGRPPKGLAKRGRGLGGNEGRPQSGAELGSLVIALCGPAAIQLSRRPNPPHPPIPHPSPYQPPPLAATAPLPLWGLGKKGRGVPEGEPRNRAELRWRVGRRRGRCPKPIPGRLLSLIAHERVVADVLTKALNQAF